MVSSEEIAQIIQKASQEPGVNDMLALMRLSRKENDCYNKALPDEPMFVLLARDPDFYRLVMEWARRRQLDIDCGERPQSDMALVEDAMKCAIDGQTWRRNNNGKWRT